MKCFSLRCVFLLALLQRSNLRNALPASVSSCCEGDILLLLDSSGSVASHEFVRLLRFAAELLRPFSLGPGHVRIGLLQVSTSPKLEFGLNVHSNQDSLQRALQSVTQLQGDTNTEAALTVAQRVLAETRENVPKVLLWLTDGVEPGDVEESMSELKTRGVSVVAVSSANGNYQLLKQVVTAPLESHLYSVEIDDIDIITKAMREAIIKLIHQRLTVVHLDSHSAVLQWHPALSSDSDHYELRFNSGLKADPEVTRLLRFDSTSAELTDLQPDTTYTVSLHPQSDSMLSDTLAVNFTTLPAILGPAVVSVSDSGSHQIRVSWGPLQPAWVQSYTVEYGALPSGRVQTVTLRGHNSSVLLTGLDPGTQYLVTVSALHVNGQERAMSVRACTQEAAADLPALVDLQLTSVEPHEVQVAWSTSQEGLRGYWLHWVREKSRTSLFLSPTCRSARLNHLTPSSQVCVSPVYSSGQGDGLCINPNFL